MLCSEQIDQLAGALAKAQSEIKSAEMNASNPHFKNQYANLVSVTAAIKDPLTKNDISYVQNPHFDFERGLVGVSTKLMHKSGQFQHFDPVWCKPARGLGPQDVGSSMTYLRRYSLASSVGITQGSEPDDDGNNGQGLDDKKPDPKKPTEPEKKYKVDRNEHNKNLIAEFAKLNINQSGLEERFGPMADWDDDTYAAARQWYRMLKERMAYEAKQRLEGKA